MKKSLLIIFAIILIICSLPVVAFASSEKTNVTGKVYEFSKNDSYDFIETDIYQETNEDNTYGTFGINGEILNVSSKDGIPAYEIDNGNISLYYNYTDTLLSAGREEWHLVNDKTKKVADITLNSNIMKGVIIVQTSKDRLNWTNVETVCNAFSDVPVRSDAIYTTTDIQLNNGCYYRIIVAYKLRISTKGFLGIYSDSFKKYAEVYEFYAHLSGGQGNIYDPNQTYRLGDKVRVADLDSYYGEEEITKNDIHYGWNIGQFYVSGFTDKVINDGENVVFLKNVGDKVTLWFDLEQNINALNGKDNLSITADADGSDQYFETIPTNFGRGALIIRYTDHNNIKSDPIIYTNYLEANCSIDADTIVQLFEEGDYEVALNYEVTEKGFLGFLTTRHYRIFFKFSVRNGNCMAYPFDIKTGDELTNSTMTTNGFYLDLVNSKYLKVVVQKQTLNDSADGLVEDTRFNRPAKDGEEFTDEGVYTITVTNQYTGATTVKNIYVGSNKVLRAHVNTGLSIREINNLVARGAVISADGVIDTSNVNFDELENNTNNPDYNGGSNPSKDDESMIQLDVVLIGVGVVAFLAIIISLVVKQNSKRREQRHVWQDADGERK